jgi:hypothetical protein
MKTIIDKNTGKVSYATDLEVFLFENEIMIDELVVDNFDNAYFDFETRTFYNVEEI